MTVRGAIFGEKYSQASLENISPQPKLKTSCHSDEHSDEESLFTYLKC
jgi:hypothetical protein